MVRNSGEVAFAVAVLAGLSTLLFGCSQGTASSGPPPGPPTVTASRPVVRQIVEWDKYLGRLQAVREVEIRAKVSGYLKSIHFQDGEIVEEGDLLFVIDPRPFESEVDRAEAAVLEAEAGLAKANAEVKQANAKTEQAAAALDLAKTREERAARLSERGAIPDAEYDVRQSELKQAEADAAASSATIALAEADVKVAEAMIATAKSKLRTANIQLGYTQVSAPISGRISAHTVSEGNLIPAGGEGPPLTTLVSVDPVHVVIDANERDFLKYMRLGNSGERASSRDAKNPILLGLVDETGFPHEGHMDFVDNAVDQQTGTMRGRAILPNPDGLLTPGLFARVRLPGTSPYDAVLIPDEAVGVDQTQNFVYVVTDTPQGGEEAREGSKYVERRPIELGAEALGLRVVRQGLTGEELVVVQGLQMLRPGAAVEVEESEISVDEESALPTDYEPWPKERWLSADGPMGADPPPENESGEDLSAEETGKS